MSPVPLLLPPAQQPCVYPLSGVIVRTGQCARLHRDHRQPSFRLLFTAMALGWAGVERSMPTGPDDTPTTPHPLRMRLRPSGGAPARRRRITRRAAIRAAASAATASVTSVMIGPRTTVPPSTVPPSPHVAESYPSHAGLSAELLSVITTLPAASSSPEPAGGVHAMTSSTRITTTTMPPFTLTCNFRPSVSYLTAASAHKMVAGCLWMILFVLLFSGLHFRFYAFTEGAASDRPLL